MLNIVIYLFADQREMYPKNLLSMSIMFNVHIHSKLL